MPDPCGNCPACGVSVDGWGRPLRSMGCMECDPDIRWLLHDSADADERPARNPRPHLLRLRAVSYRDTAGASWSAFVALTDAEFSALPSSGQPLAPFKGRMISVVPGLEPADVQRKAALAAFALRFG